MMHLVEGSRVAGSSISHIQRVVNIANTNWDFFDDTKSIRSSIRSLVVRHINDLTKVSDDLYRADGRLRSEFHNRTPMHLRDRVKTPESYGSLFLFSGNQANYSPVEIMICRLAELLTPLMKKAKISESISSHVVAAELVLNWADAAISADFYQVH